MKNIEGKPHPELIVMLTHNDLTIENAEALFEACKNSRAQYWGFKEHPLPLEELKVLSNKMKVCGKTTFLEVVAYTEEEGLRGAEMAVECQCDILMGTIFHDSINDFCKAHGLRYMPFVGRISGRPSVLEGSIEEMIAQAREYIVKGVFGIDLLAYRYSGDAENLCKSFIKAVDAPVCVAGSINSYERLDIIKEAAPWAFTIGGAFLECKFGGEFAEQIEKVERYMAEETEEGNEVVDYYENIAFSYDESRFDNSYGRFIDTQERRILDRLINTQEDTLRLEMACGTGRLTNYATHGLDASENMMQLARRKHPDVEYKLASAADTGYEDGTFDIIYSFHLLMHLDKDLIQAILEEAHRILKPGGRLIIDIPSRKRRALLHHRQPSWHGATGLASDDIKEMVSRLFKVKSSHGVMMLPVHKLPKGLRQPLTGFDYWLASGWLKEYSSYIVFELEKGK